MFVSTSIFGKSCDHNRENNLLFSKTSQSDLQQRESYDIIKDTILHMEEAGLVFYHVRKGNDAKKPGILIAFAGTC